MEKNQLIVAAVVGVVVLVGGVWFLSQRNNPAPVQTQNVTSSPQVGNSSSSATQTNVKEVTVSGSNFKFDPAEIRVKAGDKVKITFKNNGGIHDLRIDGLNVATKRLDSGESEAIEFTANKIGTFEYYCSVANHKAMGMVGKLIVE